MTLGIKRVIRREDTLLRFGGDAYVTGMTWTNDDRQLVAVVDGPGCAEVAPDHPFDMSRMFAIDGEPQRPTFQASPGYPDMPIWDYYQGGAPYYGFNVLAVGERIYQFLSTEHRYGPADEQGSWPENALAEGGFTHTKLVYSPDNGCTWCNQDGSTPITRELRRNQSRHNMVFFEEHQDAFFQASLLQMGKGYEDNRDGYVYVYGPTGRTDLTLNALVMFRVPKDQILDRRAYQYFAGLRSDGSAEWVNDIKSRGIVYTFPPGRASAQWPLGWLPCVAYNAPLDLYVMVSGSGTSTTCVVPEPTYLGFWVARHPWGPWSQIGEEDPWLPDGDPAARAVGPVIAPRWIGEDGKSFWLVWTDVQQTIEEDLLTGTTGLVVMTYEERVRARRRWGEFHPYFGLNAQRVDLVVE